jgi:hypothetical protein
MDEEWKLGFVLRKAYRGGTAAVTESWLLSRTELNSERRNA